MEVVRKVAIAMKGGKAASSSNNNLNLIEEEAPPNQYFPYSSKEIKDHILELDSEIIALAIKEIALTEAHIQNYEHKLNYEELKRVAWTAEIAKDEETLLHIVEMMVDKQTMNPSLNEE